MTSGEADRARRPSPPRSRWARALLASTLLALTWPASTRAQPAAGFASARPTPRIDYWQARLNGITRDLADTADLRPVKVVFIGDSITDFWLLDANPWIRNKWCGKAVWDESFGPDAGQNRALNLGISGDRIEHVLYRLQPAAAGGLGELDRADLDPDFLVIMLGINNSYEAEEPAAESILAGVKTAVARAHERKPRARIVLESLLPTDDMRKNREVVDPVNAGLAAFAAEPRNARFITYLDLHRSFVDADGKQVPALFNDSLHPSREGYRVWRDQLVPLLASLRGAGPRRAD